MPQPPPVPVLKLIAYLSGWLAPQVGACQLKTVAVSVVLTVKFVGAQIDSPSAWACVTNSIGEKTTDNATDNAANIRRFFIVSP